MTWQPIETAPKDRTRIVLLDDTGVAIVGFWSGATNWVDDQFDCALAGITHWIPLPEPPKMNNATQSTEGTGMVRCEICGVSVTYPCHIAVSLYGRVPNSCLYAPVGGHLGYAARRYTPEPPK